MYRRAVLIGVQQFDLRRKDGFFIEQIGKVGEGDCRVDGNGPFFPREGFSLPRLTFTRGTLRVQRVYVYNAYEGICKVEINEIDCCRTRAVRCKMFNYKKRLTEPFEFLSVIINL